MDAKCIVKLISRHPIVHSQMGMQMQLGLPSLIKKNGKLCMCFKPHKEVYKDGYIEFYPQQYVLELVYPFEQVIRYENLLFEMDVDVSKPVCRVSADKMAGKGAFLIGELYDECSRVLNAMDKNGTVSDLSIEYYEKAYQNAVTQLGLSALYGSDPV